MKSLFLVAIFTIVLPSSAGASSLTFARANDSTPFAKVLEIAPKSPEKAIRICEQETAKIELETADIEAAMKLEFLARFYAKIEKNSLADPRIKKAKQIATRLNARDLLRRINQIESVIACQKGEFERGIDASTKCIELTKPNSAYLAIPLSERGICYLEMEEITLGLEDLERALKIATKAKNHKLAVHVRVNLGNAYDMMKEYDRAIEVYTAALTLAGNSQFFKKPDSRVTATIMANLGSCILANVPQENWDQLQLDEIESNYQLQLATSYFQRALFYASDSMPSVTATARIGLGDICLIKQDLFLAKSNYDQALELYKKTHDVKGISHVNSRLARVLVVEDRQSRESTIKTHLVAISDAATSNQFGLELELIDSVIPHLDDKVDWNKIRELLERAIDLKDIRWQRMTSQAIQKAEESIAVIEQGHAIDSLEQKNQYASLDWKAAAAECFANNLDLCCCGCVYRFWVFVSLETSCQPSVERGKPRETYQSAFQSRA